MLLTITISTTMVIVNNIVPIQVVRWDRAANTNKCLQFLAKQITYKKPVLLHVHEIIATFITK